jgi:hypothetical protein
LNFTGLPNLPKASTMSDRPLIDFIVNALVNLGGRRHLSEIYQEVERLGYPLGGQDLHKAIRKRIYEHSSDSPQFTGGDDFFHTDRIGSGYWQLRSVHPRYDQVLLPEEVASGSAYDEGDVQQALINRYERDPAARAACVSHYGTECSVCGFDFVAVYGEVMAGFTHVHHLRLLSTVGPGYQVDPIQDLRPVCPNCHAVIHRREPPYTIEEVRAFRAARKGRRRTRKWPE